MIYSKLDLFSSQFQFGIGGQYKKKGTLFGTLLSMIIVLTTFAYFVYILYQYQTNQIEPNFRTQSFITEDTIDIDLNTDLVGFQFVYGTQPNFNKTYISFLAYYHLQIQDNFTMIPLNIINCTNPNLEGFQCLDFSTLNNYKLTLNTKQNIQSALWIFTYRCIDEDTQKTSISDNCANETDIDNIINDKNSIIRLKLFTSQYNTSSQQMQVNYRNAYINPVSTLQILTQIKSEKQVTSIKEGAIVQYEKSFSSPISYSQQDQPTDRVQSEQQVGVGSISSIFIYPDEIVQNTQIQFLALPQILASIYSVFTLLMFLGVFGRQISSSLLNNDLLHIFMKNIYLDTYLKIADCQTTKQENLYQVNLDSRRQDIKESQAQNLHQNNRREFIEENAGEVDEQKPEEEKSQIFVPAFRNRQKNSLDVDQSSNLFSPTNFDRQAFLQKQALVVENQEVCIQKCQDKLINRNSVISQYNEESCQEKQNIIQDCVIEEPTQQYQITQKTEMTPGNLVNRNLVLSFYNDENFKDELNNLQDYVKEESTLQHQITQKSEMSPENCQRSFIQSQIKSNFKIKQEIDSQSKQICQSKINKNFFKMLIQKILSIQDANISKKIRSIFSKVIFCRYINLNSVHGITADHQNKIQKQITNDQNILSYFRDILFLKKAVMLMMTKDQLAILQLIGCSSNFLDLDLDKLETDPTQLEKFNSLSHFEAQFAIYQSKSLQKKYADKFLQRCYENEKLSYLDNKILSSLKKSYQNCTFNQTDKFDL